MSNNPKFPRRVVKKRLSINWGRFTVFYTVLCSISVIIGLLAHKIIVQGKEANIQKNLAVREKIVKKQHPTLHTSPRIGVVTQDNQQVFGENSYKQQNNTNPESSPPSVVVKPVVKETHVTINQFDNPTQIEQIRLLPPFD